MLSSGGIKETCHHRNRRSLVVSVAELLFLFGEQHLQNPPFLEVGFGFELKLEITNVGFGYPITRLAHDDLPAFHHTRSVSGVEVC